jgi:hypothetical protein
MMSKTVKVKDLHSTNSVSFELQDGECPACTAIQKFGCDSGLIFLECESIIYRCCVQRILGLVAIACSIVTYQDVYVEIAMLEGR